MSSCYTCNIHRFAYSTICVTDGMSVGQTTDAERELPLNGVMPSLVWKRNGRRDVICSVMESWKSVPS
jgi:hypothetical protein